MKELICINCPRGCRLTVDDSFNVSGNFCPRGEKYAKDELTHPVRTLTSTIKIINSEESRAPVKSNKPLPKELIFKAMDEINKVTLSAPLKIGDIAIKNIFNLDIDIIITKNIDK